MAKANQDSLLAVDTNSKKFSVPKNLLVVIMLLLIALVVVVFAIQAAMGPPPKNTLKLKPEVDVGTRPGIEVIDGIDREQTESGKRLANERKLAKPSDSGLPTPINPTPLPEIDGAGKVALPAPPQGNGNREDDAIARELLIRNAPIMAITDNSIDQQLKSSADKLGSEGINPNQMAKDHLKDLMAAARPQMGGAGSKADNDKEWTKENAILTSGREVSRGYAPASRFTLMQGSVINAVLRTAVNTDLPGELQARVLMDVYDSIAGKHLLIPKGTTLIGVYNSEVRIGQDRVNMAFKRMILPNGISVDLPGNIGMDSAGMGGVEGSVNNHYGQMFFVSTLTAIGAYMTNRNQPTSGSGTTVNTSSTQSAAGSIFIDMNKAVIDRNKAMEPTITIPSGIRFMINVARDIELAPYSK